MPVVSDPTKLKSTDVMVPNPEKEKAQALPSSEVAVLLPFDDPKKERIDDDPPPRRFAVTFHCSVLFTLVPSISQISPDTLDAPPAKLKEKTGVVLSGPLSAFVVRRKKLPKSAVASSSVSFGRIVSFTKPIVSPPGDPVASTVMLPEGAVNVTPLALPREFNNSVGDVNSSSSE